MQHGLLFVLQLLIGDTDVGPTRGVSILSSTVSYDLTAVFLRCQSMNQRDSGVAFFQRCVQHGLLFVLPLQIGGRDVCPMLGVFISSSTVGYDLCK